MAKAKEAKFESNPFKVIFSGFDQLFKYNQTMAILILALSVFGSIGRFFNFHISGNDVQSANPEIHSAVIVGIVVFFVLIAIISSIFIGTMINGLVSYIAYKTSLGETTDLSSAAKVVWNKFWTILSIEVSVFFRVVGGLILFFVPGIRAMMRYDMVLFPVFEDNADAKQAIATSKAITKNHIIEIFGMNVAANIIPFVGSVFHVGGQSVMYPQLKSLHKSGAPAPKVHWLNYLAFIILLGVVILISIIIGCIALAIAK